GVPLFIIGLALVLLAGSSAVRTTILPRESQDRLSRVTILGVRLLFRLRTSHITAYRQRDRIMALLGPVALLVLLLIWLVLDVFGFTLIFLALQGGSFGHSLQLSGASITTLGTSVPRGMWSHVVSYTEAGLGLLILTLLITYLPTIYGAFSRREIGVSLLRVRAGVPPRAATMMIRFHRIEEPGHRLSALWQSWEAWFADVEETHTSFPILAFFRSPVPDQSWITAAGALLDSASIWVAAVRHPNDPDAQLCIRAGFQTLARLAATFRVPYDDDPQPDAPISVSRSEFEDTLDEMAEAGVPIKADRDAAWVAWSGWRVNYDTALLNLARVVEAPLAPWVSDRTPLPAHLRWTLTRSVVPRLPRSSGNPGPPGSPPV
ncbi:MAG: hypothetical protein ACRDYC_06690, partial [Acidimicrobiales bacterium]